MEKSEDSIKKKILWIISDGTGRTASQLIKAASYQFDTGDVEFRIVKDVTDEKKIRDVVERVKKESGMVVYTLVSKINRRLMYSLCMENHILSVDLFGPLISTMEKFLQKVPKELPGLTYKLNRDYYRMVDAVDFTIKHDDGASINTAVQADIILIGPSRVGKTPLSVYLAYSGWKVANIPIVKELKLPDILEKNPLKVFCLIIEPSLLQKRRMDRIKKLGNPRVDGYTDLKSITEEIEYCKKISNYGKRWPLIDVSYRTVEDIAKEIIQLVSI